MFDWIGIRKFLWRSTSNYLFVILKKRILWRSTSNYLFVILKKEFYGEVLQIIYLLY